MTPYYAAERLTLLHGDCRTVLAELPECSVDAIVTDPPYDLTAGKKGGTGEASVNLDSPYGRARITTGFMGKRWDGTGVAFEPETWAEALRVLKPGAHLVAFGAPRTHHRLACAIEDAGFEVRDVLMYLFGSGFPKSLNLHGEWEGWGTALKPAYEPIVMARKPLGGTVAGNVAAYGVGGLNIDGCRIEASDAREYAAKGASVVGLDSNRNGSAYGEWASKRGDSTSPHGRWPANVLLDTDAAQVLDAMTGSAGGSYAYEPEGARPLSVEGAPAQYLPRVTGYGDIGGASRFFYTAKTSRAEREFGLDDLESTRRTDAETRDSDAPGSNNPRLRTNTRRNDHPTVKPVDLMRWLCRLVTPPGGTICDPFLGSGSTGMAALDEGFRFIGIDLEQHYLDIAQRRITRRHAIEPMPQPDAGQAFLTLATGPVIPTYSSRIEHWLAQGDQAAVAHAIAFWEFSKGESQAMTEQDRAELEKVTGYREHPSERLEVSK